jgi:hypothetical protein
MAKLAPAVTGTTSVVGPLAMATEAAEVSAMEPKLDAAEMASDAADVSARS